MVNFQIQRIWCHFLMPWSWFRENLFFPEKSPKWRFLAKISWKQRFYTQSLLKPYPYLFSRNFCQKSERNFLEFPHIAFYSTLGVFTLMYFWEKFRESYGFTKLISRELIWQNIFDTKQLSQTQTTHTVEIMQIYSHSILTKISKFRENDIFKIRKEFLNSWFDEMFYWCTQCSVEKREIISHWKKISSNQLFSKQLLLRNFCEKVWKRISAFSTQWGVNFSFFHNGQHATRNVSLFIHYKNSVKS